MQPVLTPTCNPSAQPSSSPSFSPTLYNESFYLQAPLLKTFFSATNVAQNQEEVDQAVFSTFSYMGRVKIGKCDDWTRFIFANFALWNGMYEYLTIEASFGKAEVAQNRFADPPVTTQNFSCSDSDALRKIVNSLYFGRPIKVDCNGHKWVTFSTSKIGTVFCVDCGRNYNSSSCAHEGMTVNPCQGYDGICKRNEGSYAILQFKRKETTLFPTFTHPLTVASFENKLTIHANVFGEGTLFCAAYDMTRCLPPTSIEDVKKAGFSTTVIAGLVVSSVEVEILGLFAETTYHVYCGTSDFQLHAMDIATVRNHSIIATTSCCKRILFDTYNNTELSSASSNQSTLSSSVRFHLNSIPNAAINTQISVSSPRFCNNGTFNKNGIDDSRVKVQPSSFNFNNSSSLPLSGSFIVEAPPGCYVITAQAKNYIAAQLYVSVGNFSRPQAPPSLAVASFSDDALRVNLYFNSPTDKGCSLKSQLDSYFPCEKIIIFSNNLSATCQWVTSSYLSATINPNTFEIPSLRVGDRVQIRDGTIRSYCDASVPLRLCDQYPYSKSSVVVIGAPLRPIIPIVSITGPEVAVLNTELTIDPTGSSGRSAQPWSTVLWTVNSSTWSNIITSMLSDYLLTAYQSTDKVVNIPAKYLSLGTFSITLTLTNCFGMSSSNTISVEVVASSSAPMVVILGPQVLYMKRWQPVQVVAQVQGISYGSSMILKWALYDSYGMVPLTSSSLDPKYFVLPAGVLNSSTSYYLSVIVYSNTSVLDSSQSSVSIYVKASSVVARIDGGDYRSSDIFQTVLINATSSYDMDYPSNHHLTYTWNCVQIYPAYHGPCELYLDSLLANTAQPILRLDPYQSSAVKSFINYTAIYNVSVVAANDKCSQSEAYTLLSIFPTLLPQFRIFSSSQKYNAASKIVFSGEISTLGWRQSLTVFWTVKEANITSLALTPTQATVVSNSSEMLFQIALRPHSLTAGMSYTFRLSSPDTNAFAEYVVKINNPPYGGALTVQPPEGFEIKTVFTLMSTQWFTEEDNYPLFYRFSYYDLDMSSQVSISQESLVPYASAILSRGLPTRNSTVFCVVFVTDTYGATANASTSVNVLSTTSNIYEMYSHYNDQLRNAVLSSDSSAIVDTISAIANSLSIKNCSASPNCTSLNRRECRSTSNTCGPCFFGYIGIDGDSNTYCGPSKKMVKIGEKCSNSTLCISNTCLDGVCKESAKSCINDCFGKGDCVYHSYYNDRPLSRCSDGNSSCYARCNCRNGSFGEDCSMKGDTFSLTRQLHDSLCSTFLKVLQWQFVSPSIIVGRARTLMNILADSSLLTSDGFRCCVQVLSQSVNDYTASPPDPEVVQSLLLGLDTALTYVHIPLNLTSILAKAVSILVRSNQKLMTPSERPFRMYGSSLSILSVVNSMDLLQSMRLFMPQSSYNEFNGFPSSSVGIQPKKPVYNRLLSSSFAPAPYVGLILTQYLTNPRGNDGFFAEIIAESVLVDEGDKTADIQIEFSLQRISLSVHATNESESKFIYCPASRTPSNVSFLCPDKIQYSVACPASLLSHSVNVTCPKTTRSEVCTAWNGSYFAASGNCVVLQKSSSNVSCACSANISTEQYYSSEVTSNYLEHLRPLQYALLPSTDSPEDSLDRSAIISIAAAAIAICLIVICLLHMRLADYSIAAMKRAKNIPSIRTLTSFFSQCVPSEFEEKSPLKLFIMKLFEKHCYFRLVHLRKLNRAVVFYALLRLTNYLLLGTILVLFFFGDLFQPCGHRTTALSCDARYFDSVCEWSTLTLSCSYHPPLISDQVIFILCISVVFLHIVMEVVLGIFMDFIGANRHFGNYIPTGSETVAKYDELVDVQSKSSNFIRAVAVTEMKLKSDSVNAVGEIKNMLKHRDAFRPEGNLYRSKKDKVNNYFDFYGDNAIPYSRADFLGVVERSPGSKLSIIQRLNRSRQEAESIKYALLSQPSDEDRDVELVKHFLSGFLKGYKSSIVKIAMFLSSKEMQFDDSTSNMLSLLRTIASLSYIFGALGCIIFFGLNVNDRVATGWIVVSTLAILEDTVLILPMDIYLRCVLVPSFAKVDFLAVYNVLSRRAKSIIARRTGGTCAATKMGTNLIQHFHPACRAARLFPNLPASRLLFSITDYDLPISHLLSGILSRNSTRNTIAELPTEKRAFYSRWVSVKEFVATLCKRFILFTANERFYWTQSALLQFTLALLLNGVIECLLLSALTGTAAVIAISIICSIIVVVFVHYLFPELLCIRVYTNYDRYSSCDNETVNQSESIFKTLEIARSTIRTKNSSTVRVSKSSLFSFNSSSSPARKSRVIISDNVLVVDYDPMGDISMLQLSIKKPIGRSEPATPLKSILKKKSSMVFMDSIADNKSNLDDKEAELNQNNLDADDALSQSSLQSEDSNRSNFSYSGNFDDPMTYLNGPLQPTNDIDEDEEEEEDQYDGESEDDLQRRVAAKIRTRLPGFPKVKLQRRKRPSVGVPLSREQLVKKIAALQQKAIANISTSMGPVEAHQGYSPQSKVRILSRLDAINRAQSAPVATRFVNPSSKKRSVAFDIEPNNSDCGAESFQSENVSEQFYSGKSRTYSYDNNFDDLDGGWSSNFTDLNDDKMLPIKSILKKENNLSVDHESSLEAALDRSKVEADGRNCHQSSDSSLSSKSYSGYFDEFTNISTSLAQTIKIEAGEEDEDEDQFDEGSEEEIQYKVAAKVRSQTPSFRKIRVQRRQLSMEELAMKIAKLQDQAVADTIGHMYNSESGLETTSPSSMVTCTFPASATTEIDSNIIDSMVSGTTSTFMLPPPSYNLIGNELQTTAEQSNTTEAITLDIHSSLLSIGSKAALSGGLTVLDHVVHRELSRPHVDSKYNHAAGSITLPESSQPFKKADIFGKAAPTTSSSEYSFSVKSYDSDEKGLPASANKTSPGPKEIYQKNAPPARRPTMTKSEPVGFDSDGIVLGKVDIPKALPAIPFDKEDKVTPYIRLDDSTPIKLNKVANLFVNVDGNDRGSSTESNNSSNCTSAKLEMDEKPPRSPSHAIHKIQSQPPLSKVQGPQLKDIRPLRQWKVSNSPPHSENSSAASSIISSAQPKVVEMSSGVDSLKDGLDHVSNPHSSSSYSGNTTSSKDMHSLHAVKLEPLNYSSTSLHNSNDRKK